MPKLNRCDRSAQAGDQRRSHREFCRRSRIRPRVVKRAV